MDSKQTRTEARQIEDLPVEAAEDVKGGQDFHRDVYTSLNFTHPGTIKGFNPQPDPPKVG